MKRDTSPVEEVRSCDGGRAAVDTGIVITRAAQGVPTRAAMSGMFGKTHSRGSNISFSPVLFSVLQPVSGRSNLYSSATRRLVGEGKGNERGARK